MVVIGDNRVTDLMVKLEKAMGHDLPEICWRTAGRAIPDREHYIRHLINESKGTEYTKEEMEGMLEELLKAAPSARMEVY